MSNQFIKLKKLYMSTLWRAADVSGGVLIREYSGDYAEMARDVQYLITTHFRQICSWAFGPNECFILSYLHQGAVDIVIVRQGATLAYDSNENRFYVYTPIKEK